MAAPPINPATARVISRFGERPSLRDHSPHFHGGLDLSTPRGRGEPVFAVDDGTVALLGSNDNPGGLGGYGNAVILRHAGNVYTLYAHLDSISVAPGQAVRAGQMVGRVGSTTNGQFSPMPGQDLAEWTRQARSRGYRSGPITPHLHLEIRARSDGGAPFPGPYPQSAAQAQWSLNPSDWLRSKGIVFTSRGGVSIAPGSEAAQSQASWQPLIQSATAMGGLGSGLGSLGTALMAPAAPAPSTMDGKGGGNAPLVAGGSPVEPGKFVPGGYEPVKFERDVRFGLTPLEWGAIGVGAVAITGIGASLVLRGMRPNRGRARRAA